MAGNVYAHKGNHIQLRSYGDYDRVRGWAVQYPQSIYTDCLATGNGFIFLDMSASCDTISCFGRNVDNLTLCNL